ncbi:hypothetical protein RYA05_02435 [Pseudomonas syringae pv. actinidiae]|nr:hypothetical protein [Pseudomonas syringae pv. actinidiae]
MPAFTLNSLGLDADEAVALAAAGQEAFASIGGGVFSDYDLKHDEYVTKALKKALSVGKLDADQASVLGAAVSVRNVTPNRFVPIPVPSKIDQGIFTHHESFACVSQNSTSTSHPTFVGTPSLDHSMVGLEFSRASLSFGDMTPSETRLSEGATLVKLYLSSEQFSAVLRDRHSQSPCALSRIETESLDTPPRLISTVSLVEEARNAALEIGKPLIDSARALQEHLASTPKISTKAEYAALQLKIEDVCKAMIEIRPPMQAMLRSFAGEVANAAVKQLIADIAEPLKVLGMSPQELLGHIV